MARAALGFCVHTGWAAAIVVAGKPAAPAVVARLRLELTDGTGARPAAAYHAALEMSAAEGEALVRDTRATAVRRARAALRALAGEHDLAAAGYAPGRTKVPAALADILAAHPLVHAAEGELFRAALVAAAEAAGLRVVAVRARDVLAHAAEALRLPAGEVQARVAGGRRGLGPPWAADQKAAMLFAWLALAAATGR